MTKMRTKTWTRKKKLMVVGNKVIKIGKKGPFGNIFCSCRKMMFIPMLHLIIVIFLSSGTFAAATFDTVTASAAVGSKELDGTFPSSSVGTAATNLNCQTNSSPLPSSSSLLPSSSSSSACPSTPDVDGDDDDPIGKVTDDEMMSGKNKNGEEMGTKKMEDKKKSWNEEYEKRLMDQLMRETLLKLKHIEEKKYPLESVPFKNSSSPPSKSSIPTVPALFPSLPGISMSSSSIPTSPSDFFSISERVTALKNVFDSILSIEKDLTWNPVVPSRMSRGFFLVKLFSNLLKIMPFQEVSTLGTIILVHV